MNKVNHFPALKAPTLAPLPRKFFFSATCGKTSLAKGTTNFIGASLPNLPIILARNCLTPD